jgi:NTE family protein
VGALIGGLFAKSGNVEDLEKLVREITYKDMAKVLFDPIWGKGLIKGEKTLAYFRQLFDDERIEDLKIPFGVVATDINTAEPVVFKKGNIAEAVRASVSVPLIYAPVEHEGHLLVDGGVSCPVPVGVAREMGAEIVIAVNLDGVYFSGDNHKGSLHGSTIDVLKDSYFALRYNLAKKEIAQADVIIEPAMKYVEDFDFIGGKMAIDVGEETTEKLMGKIKSLV